jgi:S-adenosylmethionine decarboxylase
LAESHLAIHTFPEEGKTYIELSSCNERMQKAFEALFAEAYGNATEA